MGQGACEVSQSLWSGSARLLSASEMEDLINRMVLQLVEVFDPCFIYLFGSFANGKANEFSDLDFLLILKNERECRNAWRKIRLIGSGDREHRPVDLLFRSLDDYRAGTIAGPAEIALSEGRCLFEQGVEHPRLLQP
jgi:predicted nucleotidyltransferase